MIEVGEQLPDPEESKDRELLDAVFGESDTDNAGLISQPALKTNFQAWHHPIKQIVRDYQWADLTKRLLEDERAPEHRHVLRYFTLPGADLLDVRVLAEAVHHLGTKIEYFGFDIGHRSSSADSTSGQQQGIYFATESALRQAGRITDNAEILKDRLEDIAQTGTQAANRLRQKSTFDVINIDACDHLGFIPAGRHNSIFDALEALLAHQLQATEPWLLFVTTRANPAQMGAPATKLQNAIHSNLQIHQDEFGKALADCIEGQLQTIASDLASSWATQGINFLKLFSVGLGKYLLQFYHGQHNLPADVELVSTYAYKVHAPEPDMLSLAFRITPLGLRVQPATAGPASVTAPLELTRALEATQRARRLWNLDNAIANDSDVREDAVKGSAKLLGSASYDLSSWKTWLATLTLRPMEIDDILP